MATLPTAAHHHHKNVSQTCNLLSQYLKESGSVRNLNLVLSPTKKSGRRNCGQIIDLNQMPPTEEKAEMTIFYNGQVIVFNEFSQDKAKEIMDLACTTGSGSMPIRNSAVKSLKVGASSLTNGLMSSQPLREGDMPIMRNASLTRFIAKRKDRIRARAPYHINMDACSSSSTALDNSKAWLGLSATNDCHEIAELQLL